MTPETIRSTGTSSSGSLHVSQLVKTLVPEDQQRPVPGLCDPIRDQRGLHTAHMLTTKWTVSEGWATPEIIPYGKIALEPSASVLHYGTESFVRRP
jgi:branched-chain amino acid aminotransferase